MGGDYLSWPHDDEVGGARVAALVTLGTVGGVAWRDRARTAGAEDHAAGRDAQARRHRYEVERPFAQGAPIRRGQHHH